MARNPKLFRLKEEIDWSIFEPALARLYQPRADGRGRPAFDPLFMFKIICLQRLFGALSSDRAAEELIDGGTLAYRMFLDMQDGERGPDANTIRQFRERLIAKGLIGELFELLLSHLREKGLMVQGKASSKIVDSVVVEKRV